MKTIYSCSVDDNREHGEFYIPPKHLTTEDIEDLEKHALSIPKGEVHLVRVEEIENEECSTIRYLLIETAISKYKER